MERLIFQHTPKCAGRSIKSALERAFGKEQVLADYDDRLGNPSSLFNTDRERYWRDAQQLRPAQRVICGHFPMKKYRHLAGIRVGTMRHPVTRAISHYFYWRSDRSFRPNSVRVDMIKKGLDILGFARLPFIQYYYRRHMFVDAVPADYDLIIFQERIEEGVAKLSELIGQRLRIEHLNKTEYCDLGPETERQLTISLADEIEFYDTLKSWPAAKY